MKWAVNEVLEEYERRSMLTVYSCDDTYYVIAVKLQPEKRIGFTSFISSCELNARFPSIAPRLNSFITGIVFLLLLIIYCQSQLSSELSAG